MIYIIKKPILKIFLFLSFMGMVPVLEQNCYSENSSDKKFKKIISLQAEKKREGTSVNENTGTKENGSSKVLKKPYLKRAATSGNSLWIDIDIPYWIYQQFLSYYSPAFPYMQTGLAGPEITLGLWKFFFTGSYMQGYVWIEMQDMKDLPSAMSNKGGGVLKEYFIAGGVKITDELDARFGYIKFQATPILTNLEVKAESMYYGLFAMVRHKIPLSYIGQHLLAYELRALFNHKQHKKFYLNNYETMNLGEAVKEAFGFTGNLSYGYNFSNSPITLYTGMKYELVVGEDDFNNYVGPTIYLNFRL